MRFLAVLTLIVAAISGLSSLTHYLAGGDDARQQLLQIAASSGDAGRVASLLRHGAHADAPDDLGVTPLMAAAMSGDTDSVRTLLTAGANPAAIDARGWTALMYAASTGHIEAVEMLLARRVPIDAVTSEGRTALMFAAGNAHPDVVRMLLAAGANSSVRDHFGDSPLTYTNRTREYWPVRRLLWRTLPSRQ